MKKAFIQIFIIVFFISLAFAYYSLPNTETEVDKVFLSLSTFLFAIFAGFFISRQGKRYSDIRKLMADFDGTMSSVYRVSGHFGDDMQVKVGEIVKNHYKPILETGEWDYSFTHKTSTLTNLDSLMDEVSEKKGLDGLKGGAVTRVLVGLAGAQQIRKNMVALREERIPGFQWLLIYGITAILFLAVSVMPSSALLISSVIKAAFISTVLVVVIMLNRLDKLQLFEGAVGAHSARDVVDIINGKR